MLGAGIEGSRIRGRTSWRAQGCGYRGPRPMNLLLCRSRGSMERKAGSSATRRNARGRVVDGMGGSTSASGWNTSKTCVLARPLYRLRDLRWYLPNGDVRITLHGNFEGVVGPHACGCRVFWRARRGGGEFLRPVRWKNLGGPASSFTPILVLLHLPRQRLFCPLFRLRPSSSTRTMPSLFASRTLLAALLAATFLFSTTDAHFSPWTRRWALILLTSLLPPLTPPLQHVRRRWHPPRDRLAILGGWTPRRRPRRPYWSGVDNTGLLVVPWSRIPSARTAPRERVRDGASRRTNDHA